jgi:hypothetical protein
MNEEKFEFTLNYLKKLVKDVESKKYEVISIGIVNNTMPGIIRVEKGCKLPAYSGITDWHIQLKAVLQKGDDLIGETDE